MDPPLGESYFYILPPRFAKGSCSTQGMSEIKNGADPEENQTTPDRTLAKLEHKIDGQSLMPKESSRLKELESIIAITAGETGEAFREINERRLYRVEYPTWKEYCNKRWNYHRSYVYRLIAFAKEVRAVEMSTNGDINSEALKNEGRFRASQSSNNARKSKEKRAKRKQLAKSEPENAAIDPEVEFDNFQETVEGWKEQLEEAAFLDLLKEVEIYVGRLLHGEETTAQVEEGVLA